MSGGGRPGGWSVVVGFVVLAYLLTMAYWIGQAAVDALVNSR